MSAVDLSTYGGLLLEQGYIGQVVDLNTAVIENKANESATVIDFGGVVVRGATDNACKQGAAALDKVLGIAVRHVTKTALADGSTSYGRYEEVPYLKSGKIFVTAGEAVVPGDVVYMSVATKILGKTSASNLLIPGATWESTTGAGQVGIIRIDL